MQHIAITLFALFLIGALKGYGQVFIITDPNFRQCIADHYPDAIDTVNKQLDTILIQSKQGFFNCSGRNISSVQGLQFFHSVQGIDLSNNKISEIPSLAGYGNYLLKFDVSNNRLTSLPEFPANLTTITDINVSDNELTSLTPIAGLTNLDSVTCHNNYLTFESLTMHDFSGLLLFKYFPQKQITINSRREVKEGDPFVFTAPKDSNVNNRFEVLRNGISIDTLFLWELPYTIPSFGRAHAGFYSWKITNPNLPLLTITTTMEEAVLSNKNEAVFTPDGDGLNDSYYIPLQGISRIFNKEGNLIREIPVPGYWDGTDLYGRLVPVGAYILKVGDVEMDITLVY